ncbi:MAG TPA: MFS transporter, partial [Phycisphaerales bacterium]|nr:MFS transporter [Phycisphaerales bacterium]
LLLSYYVVNLCAIPFWVWVGKRIEKHTAWILGMLTFVITNPFYLLLGPGDIYWMTLGLMITGFGGATSLIFPNSMKADVIDMDKISSGEDRAAIFFSVWSFVIKIAFSFGPWFALMLLSYSSYDPTPEAMNSESQLFGLRYIYALSTTIFMGATILTIYNYPLTKKKHEEIREELEALNN